MTGVDPRLFEHAISKIEDGFIFEKFAAEFLAQVLGYNFVPVGGLKDRGIDGLEHLFHRGEHETLLYQMSIEKNYLGKLKGSLKKLKDNKITFRSFCFVTNQEFKNQEIVIDQLFEEFRKPIQIYDTKWLSARVNSSPGTVNVYNVFVRTYLHEYDRPGKSYIVGDLVKDPRLYVFLRQQWDINRDDLDLQAILADTLILYCLEGTDPDKGKFKTKDELKSDIVKLIAFDFKHLQPIIDKRLQALSQKPRKIIHHSAANAYCLPYETRVQIQERNLQDSRLYEQFRDQTENDLKGCLSNAGITVKDSFALVEKTINQIFHQQGLEFADFVTHGENPAAFEKSLYDTISSVVDSSPVVPKNKEGVKYALTMAIRKMTYDGTPEQNHFLMKLSHTYLMLFMLQCDPKLCMYFSSMASKLNVYVCTSIIIPALSEFYVDPVNRRHWNLLKGAREAGVTLIVNEPIIHELASHFRLISNKYYFEYEDVEDIYLADELQIGYIDEIMIRAYFYAKFRGQVKRFSDFVDNFVTPDLVKAEAELIEWLKEEFGIQFRSDKSLDVTIDRAEEELLYAQLKVQKSADAKARTDAKLILTIYKIREKHNEISTSGIFGYKTWWLSKDTVTQRVVNSVFKRKYEVSCYMRPDFLYDYISLAPTKTQIESAYSQLFPSMLGVNISYHLPSDVVEVVHGLIREHKDKNHSRICAILHTLAERLKTEPNSRNKSYVKKFLQEQLKEP